MTTSSYSGMFPFQCQANRAVCGTTIYILALLKFCVSGKTFRCRYESCSAEGYRYAGIMLSLQRGLGDWICVLAFLLYLMAIRFRFEDVVGLILLVHLPDGMQVQSQSGSSLYSFFSWTMLIRFANKQSSKHT